MNRPNGVFKWLLYSFLCAVADGLDTILSAFTSNRKPTESLLPSDTDALSNEEIIELRKKPFKRLSESGVIQVTPLTVTKSSQDFDEIVDDASEANALNLVFSNTDIPVPRVRRVVRQGFRHVIVMDYIKGPALADVWQTLSVWKKIHVAFTLRRYIRQLRSLTAPPSAPPGPLSVQGPRTCESPIFGQVQSFRGPFASYAELSTFFNKRCKMALDIDKIPEDHPSREELFDDSSPLVLTHQDLNPRNIILGEDGRLWIIDWAWAGYYPPWFEYVAMRVQAEHERMHNRIYPLWDSFIPFICGPYFKQDKWLWNMSLALDYV